MPLKIPPLDEPALNLTPMIDVVFNLIIFFMVGTQFSDLERQLDLTLPEVSVAQPLMSPPDEIVINVYRDGKIVVSQNTVSLAELQELLVQAQARYAEQAVLIRGEGSAAYQQVMDVMNACQVARLKNFSLAAQIRSEGSP